jgi:hypothetical protein
MLTGDTLVWEAFWWLVSLASCVIFAEAMWRTIKAPSMRLARKIVLEDKTHFPDCFPKQKNLNLKYSMNIVPWHLST